MSSFQKPLYISDVFNTSLYDFDESNGLTIYEGDRRYLKLSGGIVNGLTTFNNSLNVNGSLSINGSAIDLSLISGVVAGTPQNSKALSLDSLGKINGGLNVNGDINTNKLIATITASDLSWQSIAGTTTIALNHTLNGTALLGSTTNSAFGFSTNDTERMRILSGGNVGIGTSTAGYKLDVNGDINTNTLLRVNRTSNGQSFNSTNGTSTCVLYHFNNNDVYFGTSTVNNFILQTNNIARMTIGSAGAISIGGNLTVTGSTTGIVNATITDTGVASLVNPLTINHLLSSGTPTAGSFRMGMLFQGPNASNNTISYGRIYSTCQLSTSGSHQGSITLSSVFAGSYVDVMTISSLTSSTNNLVAIAGATSVLSVYNISATIGTFSSNLTISKAAAPNLTIVSSTASSLSQLFLNTDNQTWEMGARGSTATIYPTNFYIYNTQMNMVMSPAGITQFLNSAVSTTSSSNAFQIAGGLYTAKAILNNSYYNCYNQFVGTSHSNAVTNAICLYDNPIFFRSQNSGDTNHGIQYSKNANWNSGNGFASVNQDGPVLYGNQSVVIGNMNSSNTETACAIFNGTTTNLLGTVNINSPPVTPSRVNIQSFGSQLGLINNANGYVTQSSQSDGTFNLICHNPSNPSSIYWFNYYFDSPSNFASQATKPRLSLSGSPSPADTGDNFRLNLGSTAGDIQIVLFNQNNLSSSYGFGANNSSIQYISAGVNGHKFYYSSMTGVGAQTNLGSLLGTIDRTGNIIAQSGLRAVGYNPNYSGKGAEIHFAADIASFFGYDRTGLSFTDMSMGNSNIFIKALTGYVGIGTTSPTCPLHVVGTGNQTTGAAYGWVNSGGGGNSTGFTNRPFSILTSNGIMVGGGELDVLSDEYFKENIDLIDDEIALKFITKIKPISFSYKNAIKNSHYGYSAQELLKNKFTVLINSTQTDQPLDERELINDEGDKFTIPRDTRLIVNLLATIPLLHRALQLSNERIESLESMVNKLIERPVVSRWLNKKTQQ